MNIEPLTLESQFKISKFKRYLNGHPEDSHRLAVENYKHFLVLVEAYKRLYKKYELLQSEHSEFLDLLNTIPNGDFMPKDCDC